MGKGIKVHLLIIDPQNDFMDQNGATLSVPGAMDDMKRVAKLLKRVGTKLEDVHVTLDSHRVIHVGNPGMWQDEHGKAPAPFTLISSQDIKDGIWNPRNPNDRKRLFEYARTLEAGGKYQVIAWPEHTLIGSWGHNVQGELAQALQEWERREFANVNYVAKGTNTYTEHYGALMAEVPDPNDPSTQLNTDFLSVLASADIVAIAGEASSHCVLTTVNQIADNIGPEHLKKFTILSDCMSPVPKIGAGPDFPAVAAAWLKDMESRGMSLMKSEDFLR